VRQVECLKVRKTFTILVGEPEEKKTPNKFWNEL
jgi:hypothetical protein